MPLTASIAYNRPPPFQGEESLYSPAFQEGMIVKRYKSLNNQGGYGVVKNYYYLQPPN